MSNCLLSSRERCIFVTPMIEIRLFVEHHADSQYFNTFVCPWIMLRQMYAHLLFVRSDYPRLNRGPL